MSSALAQPTPDRNGLVVVTINYRIRAFGFVNFGSLPGAADLDSNVGLLSCVVNAVREPPTTRLRHASARSGIIGVCRRLC
jgi:hypothetical protein